MGVRGVSIPLCEDVFKLPRCRAASDRPSAGVHAVKGAGEKGVGQGVFGQVRLGCKGVKGCDCGGL